MTPTTLPLGERLKRARGTDSIDTVAKRAGVHPNWWGKVERGVAELRQLKKLEKMVRSVGGRLIIRFPGEHPGT